MVDMWIIHILKSRFPPQHTDSHTCTRPPDPSDSSEVASPLLVGLVDHHSQSNRIPTRCRRSRPCVESRRKLKFHKNVLSFACLRWFSQGKCASIQIVYWLLALLAWSWGEYWAERPQPGRSSHHAWHAMRLQTLTFYEGSKTSSSVAAWFMRIILM